MSFLTLAERNHGCSVELPGGEQDCLERFLQKPRRTMAALLSRERMTPLGQGRFLYQSRPFRVLQFEITPVVVFQAALRRTAASRIDFEDSSRKASARAGGDSVRMPSRADTRRSAAGCRGDRGAGHRREASAAASSGSVKEALARRPSALFLSVWNAVVKAVCVVRWNAGSRPELWVRVPGSRNSPVHSRLPFRFAKTCRRPRWPER